MSKIYYVVEDDWHIEEIEDIENYRLKELIKEYKKALKWKDKEIQEKEREIEQIKQNNKDKLLKMLEEMND